MTGSGYRKLGRTSSQRKALLRNQITQLLYHGKITTTDTRAKEVRRLAEKLITLAVKEKDNFTEVEVTAKVPKKDANGARVKETVNGKKVTVYDEVKKTIKKVLRVIGGGAESINTMKNMDYSLYFVFDCQEKKDEGSTGTI